MGVNKAFRLWEMTYESLTHLSSHEPRLGVYVNGIMLSTNIDGIPELLEYCKNNSIDIDMSLPIFSDGYLDSAKHYKLFNLSDHQKEWIDNFLGNEILANKTGLKFIKEVLKYGYKRRRTLGCVFRNIGAFIEPNGNMFACGYIKESYSGNIIKQSFDEVWDQSQAIRYSNNLKRFCNTCNANCFPEEATENNLLNL